MSKKSWRLFFIRIWAIWCVGRKKAEMRKWNIESHSSYFQSEIRNFDESVQCSQRLLLTFYGSSTSERKQPNRFTPIPINKFYEAGDTTWEHICIINILNVQMGDGEWQNQEKPFGDDFDNYLVSQIILLIKILSFSSYENQQPRKT